MMDRLANYKVGFNDVKNFNLGLFFNSKMMKNLLARMTVQLYRKSSTFSTLLIPGRGRTVGGKGATKSMTGKNLKQDCRKRSLVYEIWCETCLRRETKEVEETED